MIRAILPDPWRRAKGGDTQRGARRAAIVARWTLGR